jgi:cation diffusion facilitator family transporter
MPAMSIQQRTALLSVGIAATLAAIKLAVGLLSHSLGLIAEAIHSGTDLVAALLTFFAVGVAVRPPDHEHPFGHGKAEHLSALGEGAVLMVASVGIAVDAVIRLASGSHSVEAQWYALAVAGVAIVLDASRWLSSRKVARQQLSAALEANALHFALDMVGSAAVLLGLLLVRSGDQQADAIAALLVAGLVLFSAGRVMRRNVQVLMDRVPVSGAQETAREAIERVDDALSLRRLRMREAGGRHFADVVVAVPLGTDVVAGHAVASAIEQAVEQALPGSDVVVHVEPESGERGAAILGGGPMPLSAAKSPYSVTETADRLVQALERRGIEIFARIDHAKGAREAGLQLGDEQLLVFGDPRVGTALMQEDPAIGYELPLRALIWDSNGQTMIGHRLMAALAGEYEVAAHAAVLQRMNGLLDELIAEAVAGG